MNLTAYKFNRMEVAGSLGDLGTLLPLAIGMILVNGLKCMGIFITIGLYYIFSGIYFRVTVPVQPMKVIGAYAIATAMTPNQIAASSILMGLFLFIIGATNLITVIGTYVPKPVIRGVQLSTGTLLMTQGVKFIMGTSNFQALRLQVEPYLRFQQAAGVPIVVIIGIASNIVQALGV